MRRKPGNITQPGGNIPTLSFSRPDDQRLLFEIIDLSGLKRNIPTASHKHDFYEFIFITKGKAKDWVDFSEYIVGEKEVRNAHTSLLFSAKTWMPFLQVIFAITMYTFG